MCLQPGLMGSALAEELEAMALLEGTVMLRPLPVVQGRQDGAPAACLRMRAIPKFACTRIGSMQEVHAGLVAEGDRHAETGGVVIEDW